MVLSSDEDFLIVRFVSATASSLNEGAYAVISGEGGEFYTKVVSADRERIRFQKLWCERREYFRVDDVFPVGFVKTDKAPAYRKSKVFTGYSGAAADIEIADDSVSPRLWKLLTDINAKLGLILERLNLEAEGFFSAPDRKVNVSATGIKFTSGESARAGDDLEIRMLLPTCPPTGIIAYGSVIRVEDNGAGEYEISVHFTDMDEETRDEIIHYALNRQREMIRMQRQQRGHDA